MLQEFYCRCSAGSIPGGPPAAGAFDHQTIRQKLMQLINENRLQAFYPPQRADQLVQFVASRDVAGLGARWRIPREVLICPTVSRLQSLFRKSLAIPCCIAHRPYNAELPNDDTVLKELHDQIWLLQVTLDLIGLALYDIVIYVGEYWLSSLSFASLAADLQHNIKPRLHKQRQEI